MFVVRKKNVYVRNEFVNRAKYQAVNGHILHTRTKNRLYYRLCYFVTEGAYIYCSIEQHWCNFGLWGSTSGRFFGRKNKQLNNIMIIIIYCDPISAGHRILFFECILPRAVLAENFKSFDYTTIHSIMHT